MVIVASTPELLLIRTTKVPDGLPCRICCHVLSALSRWSQYGLPLDALILFLDLPTTPSE